MACYPDLTRSTALTSVGLPRVVVVVIVVTMVMVRLRKGRRRKQQNCGKQQGLLHASNDSNNRYDGDAAFGLDRTYMVMTNRRAHAIRLRWVRKKKKARVISR